MSMWDRNRKQVESNGLGGINSLDTLQPCQEPLPTKTPEEELKGLVQEARAIGEMLKAHCTQCGIAVESAAGLYHNGKCWECTTRTREGKPATVTMAGETMQSIVQANTEDLSGVGFKFLRGGDLFYAVDTGDAFIRLAPSDLTKSVSLAVRVLDGAIYWFGPDTTVRIKRRASNG